MLFRVSSVLALGCGTATALAQQIRYSNHSFADVSSSTPSTIADITDAATLPDSHGALDASDALAVIKDGATVCPSNMVPIATTHIILGGLANVSNPLHSAKLPAYCIDKYEVTNAQFRTCVHAGICRPQSALCRQFDDRLPATCIDWNMASSFCSFAGKRLPSGDEWEYAARARDGRRYPWGNAARSLLVTRQMRLGGADPDDVSPFGVFDLGGNVFEWVEKRSLAGMAPVRGSTDALTTFDTTPTNFSESLGVRCATSL
jgi:Sulfatase-modifying factor enzyme 1